jgi:hypothetical protein
MPDDRCCHCGAPATLLCDHVLGREWNGSAIKPAADRLTEHSSYRFTSATGDCRIFTCDRPLCDACAANEGATFYDGTTPGGGRRRGWIVSTDYCRDHAGGQDMAAVPVLSGAEADALRNRMVLRVAPGRDRDLTR